MNFANESAFLAADKVRNEVVTIHKSQVLKMLSYLHVYIYRNCFVKKTQVQQSFLHLQHTRHKLSLDGFSNYVVVLALDFDTPVS
jgi:isocitrate/isopropylmalate dehydrogenase